MAKDHNWDEGGSHKSELGGMKRYAANEKRSERRIVEYPDGRREIIETVIEENVRSDWFSASTWAQYKIAAAAHERLAMPAARQEIPLHNLQTIKNELMQEIQQKIGGLASRFLPHSKIENE